MGKKHPKNIQKMGYKPKALGYNAQQKVDDALMANSMAMQYAASVMTNDLSREGIYKAVGMVMKECAEVQKVLTEAKYLGK